jgi:hypothetical protein
MGFAALADGCRKTQSICGSRISYEGCGHAHFLAAESTASSLMIASCRWNVMIQTSKWQVEFRDFVHHGITDALSNEVDATRP